MYFVTKLPDDNIAEKMNDTRANSRDTIDRRKPVATGNNSDATLCFLNKIDVSEPTNNAAGSSVADDVVVVDVALGLIQTTSCTSPVLNLTQQRSPSPPRAASKMLSNRSECVVL